MLFRFGRIQLPNWPRIKRLSILLCLLLICFGWLKFGRDSYNIYPVSSLYQTELVEQDLLTDSSYSIENELSTTDVPTYSSPQLSTPREVNRVRISVYNPSNLATIFTTLIYPNSSRLGPNSSEHEQAFYLQTHYKNTMQMMGRLRPRMSPIVFTNDVIASELALYANNTVLPITKTNVFGMPVLNQMFIESMHYSTSFFYGYTNGDMLYPRHDIISNLAILQGLIEGGDLDENVLIIGRRTNVVYVETTIVQTDEDIYKLAERGELYGPDAQDFMFVTRSSFDWHVVPDFVVGRTAYDNWIVDFAYHRDYSIIDLTKTLVAIHQTGLNGIKASHWSARGIDKKWNHPLAKGKVDHGTVEFAQFVSDFRYSQRGNSQSRYWTLIHKARPEFYFEFEYDTLTKSFSTSNYPL